MFGSACFAKSIRDVAALQGGDTESVRLGSRGGTVRGVDVLGFCLLTTI